MKRIRLLVQVQPWQRANESGVETPLQEKILPWTEPCLDTTLISELAERIAARFEAIHSDKGKLDIKWLEDGYGGILDGNCTVDECFEDRAGGKVDIKDFTVRVIRAPPDPAELPDTPNQTRSGSLAPNSSARPRKRSANNLSGIATGNHDYTLSNGSGEPANKRQRLEELPTQDIPDPDQPILSKEKDLDEANTALTNSIGHTSFSIPDSQNDDSATPTREQTSYGTPQSIPLASPQNPLPLSYNANAPLSKSPFRFARSPINDPIRDSQMPNNDEPKSESPDAANIIYSVPPSNPGTPVANPSVRAPEPAPMAQTENRPEAFLKPALPITDRETHHGLLTSVQTPVPKQPRGHRNLQDSGTKQRSLAAGKLGRPTKTIGFLLPERGQENHQSASHDMFDPESIDGDKSSSQELPDLPSPKRSKNQETKGLQTSKTCYTNGAVSTENDLKNMSLGFSDPLANWPETGVQQVQACPRSNGKSAEVGAEAQHVKVPGQKLVPRQEPLVTEKRRGQESSPESSKKRKRDGSKGINSNERPPEQDPASEIPGDKTAEDQSTSMEQTKSRLERARKLSEQPDGVDVHASILKHMTNSEKLARRRADVVTKALSKERELSSKLIVHASPVALHPALKSAKSGSPLATSITESKEKRPTKSLTTAQTSPDTAARAVSFAEKPTEVPRGELAGLLDDSETPSGLKSPPVLKSVINRPGTPFKSSSRKKRQTSAAATKKAANGKERVADQPSPKKASNSSNTVEEPDGGESSEPDYEPPALKGNSGPSRIGKTSAPVSAKANVSEMKSLSQGTANARRKEPETSVLAIQSPTPMKGLKAGQPTTLTIAEASGQPVATSAAPKPKPSPLHKSSNALLNGPTLSRSSTTPSESSSNEEEEEEEEEESLLPAEVTKKVSTGISKENSRKLSKESASGSESTSDEEDEQSSSQAEDIKQSMETPEEPSRASSSESSSAGSEASLNKEVGATVNKVTATAGSPSSKVLQQSSSPESETSSEEEEEEVEEEERDPNSKVDQQPPQVNVLVEEKSPAAELPEASSKSPSRSPGKEVLSSESSYSSESEEEDRVEGKKEGESEDESESESETQPTSKEAGEPKQVEKVSQTSSNTKDEKDESESESEEDEDGEDESSEEEDTEDVESKEIKPISRSVPSSGSKDISTLGASSAANVSSANGTMSRTSLQAPSSSQSVNAQSPESKQPEAKKDRSGTTSPDEAAKQLQREASQSQNYSSPMSSQSKKPTSAPGNGVPSANKSAVNGKRSNALPSLSTMKAKLLSSTSSNVSPTVKLQVDDPFSDASESDDSDDSDEESDSDDDDGRPSKIEPKSSASNNVSSENKKYRALMKAAQRINKRR